MSEPFEFINPLESFQAAREAPAEITPAGHGARRRIGLWVVGASIVSIGALIFAYAFAPNGGEQAGKPAPIESRAAPAHAITVADVASTGSVGAPALSSTTHQLAEAAPEPVGQVASETHDAEAQWVTTSLAAALHSGPSVSAPIVAYYPVGTVLRTAGQQSGWVKAVDPATSQQGWIYQIYLSPAAPPVQQAARQTALLPPQEEKEAELETPDGVQAPAPDSSGPSAKSPRNYARHRDRGTLVIRFGFGHFRVRL